MKRSSFKSKIESSTSSTLELIHMDLCGRMRTASINRKKYVLVMIDDYSRYTWLEFLRNKSDAPKLIINFIKRIQVRLQFPVRTLHSDNGTEFKNDTLLRYLISAVATAWCYILIERQGLSKFDKKADEGYFVGYSLTSKAYWIYHTRNKMVVESRNVSFDDNSTRTFEHNCSELGLKHKASIQPRIEPTSKPSTSSNSNSISSELDLLFIDVFDKGITTSIPSSEVPTLPSADIPSGNEVPSTSAAIPEASVSETPVQDVPRTSKDLPAVYDEYNETNTQQTVESFPNTHRWTKDHPLHNVIGDVQYGVKTLVASANFYMFSSFLSSLEPKKASEALRDPYWISAMQDELLQF
ncbi:hypothetical protein L6452_19230 [Arctium lappa]|uniref:Uncharacterized protein n=1 Tax=Arctium lappa TaxID=4217 RepID=A0ACB9B8E2_ARCLA|nr:hypothetical protein L6452_19230 [Arctium lappa]